MCHGVFYLQPQLEEAGVSSNFLTLSQQRLPFLACPAQLCREGGDEVGLMAFISWSAHTGIVFRSFLFCLETSTVHSLISSNFIYHTLKKKSALSTFSLKMLSSKKTQLLLLLMSCCYSPVFMSDLKIN